MKKIYIGLLLIFILILTLYVKKKDLEHFEATQFGQDFAKFYDAPGLECDKHFKLMVDPNLPSTKGCYISLADMKKYINPNLTDCPTIWNLNTEIDGVRYCRHNGANLPVNEDI